MERAAKRRRRGPARSGSFVADDDLVAEVGAGNEDALSELYERHSCRVYALARRILCDVELAEDVVASVFVALWRRPDAYDPRLGSLRAHLLMDARERSLDLVDPDGDHTADVGDTPSDGTALLSARERQIIELAYFGGRTSQEIGVMFGMPAATVCRIIRSGLEQLRREGRMAQGAGRPPS